MKELYSSLKELADNPDLGFTLTEQECFGHKVHIFSYRIVTHNDFLQRENALESRGITFLVDDEEHPVIISRPFEKFFNWKENELTMNVDFSDPIEVADKADGSMISTLMIDDKLLTKSKTSLFSDMAMDANSWLTFHPELKAEMIELEKAGYTSIFEWCAPHNRIVCYYDEPQLIALAVRHRESGHYLTKQELESDFPVLTSLWTKQYNPAEVNPETIKDMEGIEGFVYWLNNGQRIKIKTEWYLLRHRAKDAVNNPKALYEAVLDEGVDDIRSLWSDDASTIKIIDDMEELVVSYYNHLVNTTQKFYDQNKQLSRKDYAIKAKAELQPVEFSCAMMLYSGKPVDYKNMMKRNYSKIMSETQ